MALAVYCVGCGKRYQVRDELAGKRVQCGCGRAFDVPMPEPAANASMADFLAENLGDGVRPVVPPGQPSCPACGARLPGGAVLCVQCGYHLNRKRRMKTQVAGAAEPKDERLDDNPYRSPRGPADAAARLDSTFQSIVWLVFSFQGRIPRRMFWLSKILLPVSLFLVAMPIAVLFPDSPAAKVAFLAAFILYTWGSLALQVKRWHDRNHPGWYMLVNAIPLFGPIYTFIELFLLRGTVGRNNYGEDPT